MYIQVYELILIVVLNRRKTSTNLNFSFVYCYPYVLHILFLNMCKPHIFTLWITGAFPLIGWKIGDEICYMNECNHSDCGTVVEWGLSMSKFVSTQILECIYISMITTETWGKFSALFIYLIICQSLFLLHIIKSQEWIIKRCSVIFTSGLNCKGSSWIYIRN